ncbi:MAG: DUF2304 family protein [Solirubrobacterales bacterium]
MKRLAALVVALSFVSASASAATFHVTSTEETGAGSLGETILEAGPGDTITLGPGTYPLTNGDVLLAQHNIILGAGADRTTVVPTGGGEAVSSANVHNATIAPPKNPSGSGSSSGNGIETKAQVIAVLVTLAMFLVILELVRRRRLAERYALLWLLATFALLVLSIWTDGLDVIANAMGIQLAANAIFLLAFGVVFVLLLHFSVATTRLAEETKILAQESARLEHELREARGEVPSGNGSEPGAAETGSVADRGTEG